MYHLNYHLSKETNKLISILNWSKANSISPNLHPRKKSQIRMQEIYKKRTLSPHWEQDSGFLKNEKNHMLLLELKTNLRVALSLD